MSRWQPTKVWNKKVTEYRHPPKLKAKGTRVVRVPDGIAKFSPFNLYKLTDNNIPCVDPPACVEDALAFGVVVDAVLVTESISEII